MPTIHLLSVDRTLIRRLEDAMGERIAVTMVQSLDGIDWGESGIVVMDHAAIPPERSLASSIAAIASAALGRPIVLATDDMDGAQVLAAVRAGAADVIARHGEGAEISSILSRLLNNAVAAQGLTGRLTMVLGTDREAAAILATDIAISHCLDRTQTLLVDCTLPSSTAEAYLDLKAEYGIASAVADLDRLDTSLLAEALIRHEPSGLALLTLDGGTASEPVGLSPNDIVGLIQLLRACYDNVVLCAGSLRNGGLLRELASQAQSIEVVCSQSIHELDATRRLLDRVAIDTASTGRLRLLVWDHDPAILLDGQRMADVLGIAAMLTVPTERVAMRNALNAGKPLAMTREGTPYLQAVRRVCGIAAPQKGRIPGLDTVRRMLTRSMERVE